MVQSGHAVEAADNAAPAMTLVFRAGSCLCALRLDDVIETMRPSAVRPLTGMPGYVRGVTVMRGVPTPVLDVAHLLGEAHTEIVRFVAVRTERGPAAFATGEVLGIRTAGTHVADPPPGALLGPAGTLVAGVSRLNDQPLLLVQCMRVLPDEVWAAAAGGRR